MRPLAFTRDEAATISLMLDKSEHRIVAEIQMTHRKHSWLRLERLEHVASLNAELEALKKLNAELCDAYGIRGY